MGFLDYLKLLKTFSVFHRFELECYSRPSLQQQHLLLNILTFEFAVINNTYFEQEKHIMLNTMTFLRIVPL